MSTRQPVMGPRALTNLLTATTMSLLGFGVIVVLVTTGPFQSETGMSLVMSLVRQLFFVFLGLVAFYVGRYVRADFLRAMAVPLFLFAMGLLVAVKMAGASVNGSQRWLAIGSLQIQPSEIYKVAVCIFLPYALERWSHLSWYAPVAIWGSVMPGILLINIQPDLGTSMVVGVISLAIVVVWGLNRRFVWSVVGLGVVAIGVSSILRPYQRQRLSSMFAMYTGHCDIKGACYQINQSKIGLGTGGILGTGPSHARTLWGFLPNANTDFIASVVGEMFGFVGMCVLVVLLASLIFSSGQSALNARDMTSRLVAFGIMSWFGFEAIVNLGSVVGWVPVTGIPLPLMSYGGTALIVNLFALGLVANISAHDGLNRSDRFRQSVLGAFWMR